MKSILAASLIALSGSSAFAGLAILAPSPTVAEGDDIEYTIASDLPSTLSPLVVDLVLGGFSTATSGADFSLPATMSVTILAGESTATFTVPTFDDVFPEGDETVTIDLANPGGLGLDFATVTIVANDNLPTVSITTTTAGVAEGGMLTYTVSRSGPTTAGLTVLLDVPTGTATSGIDHNGAVNQVTIPASSASTTFNVQTLTDSVVDPDETVIMSVALSAAYTIDQGSATGVITDNNTAGATDVSADGDATEGSPLTFRITRSEALSGIPITYSYTVSGTATPGSDFTAPSGTVILPAGAAEMLITIPTTDDAVAEFAESVTVTVTGSSPTVTLGTATATANIIDNEAIKKVRISTSTPQVKEGGTIDFLVERSGDPSAALTVGLANGGSATNGRDYTRQPTSITVPAGSSSATVSLKVRNDNSREKNETVKASIVARAGYTIASGGRSATSTISDAADRTKPSVWINTIDSDASENANRGRFSVRLSKASKTDITVRYRVKGTATDGDDFRSLSGTVRIKAGRKFANLQIVVVNDGLREATETVRLRLRPDNTQYFLRGSRAGTVRIRDNDWFPAAN